MEGVAASVVTYPALSSHLPISHPVIASPLPHLPSLPDGHNPGCREWALSLIGIHSIVVTGG